MTDLTSDTIVGISSALGASPRGIVKLSGPDALKVAGGLFLSDRGSVETTPGFRCIRGAVSWRLDRLSREAAGGLAGEDAGAPGRAGEDAGAPWRPDGRSREPAFAANARDPGTILLPAHAFVFRAPRSYTREDVAELHVPGVPWLLDDLVAEACRRGARPAGPGEFTRRAFLNGRIPLARAEAVLGLIRAQTEAEAREMAGEAFAARRRSARRIAVEVRELLALLEIGLDFSEEDIEIISRRAAIGRLEPVVAALGEMLEDAERPARRGGRWRIVLAGPTNAGKSSLFNALACGTPALVSESRNTTRDPLTAPMRLDGLPVCLVDTAGFSRDDEDDLLIRLSGQRTIAAMRTADVLLVMADRSAPGGEECRRACAEAARARAGASVLVWSKADLRGHSSWGAADDRPAGLDGIAFSGPPIRVSAVTGQGIAELRERLRTEVLRLAEKLPDPGAGRERRAQHLRSAAHAASNALRALGSNVPEDLVATDLRQCLLDLSELEGRQLGATDLSEAVLDDIFRRFCVGK